MRGGKQRAVRSSDNKTMNGSISLTRPDASPTVRVSAPTTPAVPVDDLYAGLKGDERRAAAETELVAAIQAIHTSEQFLQALNFHARLHKYSMWNSMLLFAEHSRRRALDPSIPEDPGPFKSYDGWQSEGRHVRKGTTGYPVFVPVKSSGRYYELNGQRVFLKRGEKAPPGVEVKKASGELVGFRVGKTFPAYLTDGEPIPEVPKPRILDGGEIDGLDPVLTTLAFARGFRVEYVDPSELAGANGEMDPRSKTIKIRDDVPDAQAQKTLIHELAHAIHHSGDGYDYHGHRGMAETEAEATAYLVTRMLGGDTSAYSVPYIAGWSAGMKTPEIKRVINKIGSAAKEIVDAYHAAHPELLTPVDELDAIQA